MEQRGNTEKVIRKRGRGSMGIHTENYTVRLEPDTAEFAKDLPGGLSHIIRQHLRELYVKMDGAGSKEEETKSAG